MDELRRIDRIDREKTERDTLGLGASQSTESKGRAVDEPPDPLRTAFERDRDRIIHCNAIRRLAHKTQVFMNPDDDHFVTRLTHTLQVSQVGRSMAVALGLNEALTEAICMGHDIGHSPFGHTGEDALSTFVDGDWLHAHQSVRVLSILEPLNLTWETLDGIRAHSWKIEPGPTTPEGKLCRFADRIAYLSHDVIDAIRADVIHYRDIPFQAQALFGDNHSQWVGTMIHAVVEGSLVAREVVMDPEIAHTMGELREFMFERVYLRPENEVHRRRAMEMTQGLVRYYEAHPAEIPTDYRKDEAPDLTHAMDYVAGMTDRFAIRTFEGLP